MVIYHIHDHTKAVFVKSLNHFLKFPDTNLSMIRIGRIRALRHIIIDRIVSPVKFSVILLIDRSVIISRHDLYMGNSKFFQIIKACQMHSIFIKGCMFFCKCQVLSSVFLRKSTCLVPGKFLYMQLINHGLFLFLGTSVFLPAFRVRFF